METDGIGKGFRQDGGWAALLLCKVARFIGISLLTLFAMPAQAALESVPLVQKIIWMDQSWLLPYYDTAASACNYELHNPSTVSYTFSITYYEAVAALSVSGNFIYVDVLPDLNYGGYYNCEYTYVPTGQTGRLDPYLSRITTSYTNGCPTPTVDPLNAYKYNWATNMCERWARPQETFTIALSGDASVEPWHKKTDKKHLASNLPFKAIVTDQNGLAKAGIEVNINSDVTAYTGGHLHNNGRPKGKLVATPAGTPTPVSTLNGTDTLPTGTTDSNGQFVFIFGAEEASSDHTITATCKGCTAPATATVKVAIKGLSMLDSDPKGYELVGSTDAHTDNHYFSEAAVVKIINLAFAYSNDPNFKQLLRINDSSLARGGTFDVKQDWTSLTDVHGGHRMGVVVDINNYHSEEPIFARFTKDNFGIYADWHKKGTKPHYHLWLLGRNQ